MLLYVLPEGAPYNVSTPLVITLLVAGVTSFAVDPLDSTPSRYYAVCILAIITPPPPPSLPLPQPLPIAAELSCMLLLSPGMRYISTHPHNNNSTPILPGDTIKTGLTVHTCYPRGAVLSSVVSCTVTGRPASKQIHILCLTSHLTTYYPVGGQRNKRKTQRHNQ